jgi:hypothetical protein
MPMMPPDADLKNHLANRRSLAQARADYVSCGSARSSQDDAQDYQTVEKAIVSLRHGIPAG